MPDHDFYAGIAGEIAGPCPVEAVFGPDDRVPLPAAEWERQRQGRDDG